MDDIVDINTLFGPLPQATADLAIDDLLTMMQRHHVKTACTISTLGVLLDSAIGNAITRAANADHPELLPVATFNPTMYFGDKDALLKWKAEGFKMARFFPARQRWGTDYAPFNALVNDLKGTGLPIMVDVEARGDISRLSQVLKGYPAPVILAHVHLDLLAEAVLSLRANPNWHIETSELVAVGAIKTIVDAVGTERLLFGTGAPHYPVASALRVLEQAGISAEARQQILATNARRLLA